MKRALAELVQLHGNASGPVLLMLMAVLATLPIAGAGMALSLGWMFRDGLALLLAGVAGVAATAYAVSLSHWVVELVHRGWAQLAA